MWMAGSGVKARDTYVGHRTKVLESIASMDGRRMLSASSDGAVKTWDLPLRPRGLTLQVQPLKSRYKDCEIIAFIGFAPRFLPFE